MSETTLLSVMNSTLVSRMVELPPDEVPAQVKGIFAEQYCFLIVAVMLVYDSLLTMNKEVKYFWSMPMNLTSFVYFLNRYTGLFGALAMLECRFAIWARTMANWVTIVSVDYILLIRVLALYSRATFLTITLSAFLAAEAVTKLAFAIYITFKADVSVYLLAKGSTACGEAGSASTAFGVIDWVMPMSFGTILLGLALYKAAEYWRMSSGLKGFELVKVLIIDQLLYFLLAIGVTVFNILDFPFGSNFVFGVILQGFGSPTLLCILGSRMMFNLKEAAELNVNQGTSYRFSTTVSEMEFA